MIDRSPSAQTPTAAPTIPSMGASLKSLRESQGLSLEDVSSRIKFGARQICALEEERWQDLPTGVSLRGLVRNYARLLGADDVALVASIAAQVPASPHQTASPTEPIHRTAPMPATMEERGGGMSWGWLFILLLFIAAALAYAYWQGWLPDAWLPTSAT